MIAHETITAGGPAALRISLRINQRRMAHMLAKARADIRRIPKRERGALIDRVARDIAAKCVRAAL